MLDGGSSPRVRSRHRSKCGHRRRVWIISACAEQTSRAISSSCPVREHLRVCGADLFAFELMEKFLGSSPRVRSRRPWEVHAHQPLGIISACAEQTGTQPERRSRPWDHLRVCGADIDHIGFAASILGSSPRVRSRPSRRGPHGRSGRIISACAEQTCLTITLKSASWDHLRVCGADSELTELGRRMAGSSPRVRSRRKQTGLQRPGERIISACAEQTRSHDPRRCRKWDHLRVCGADRGDDMDMGETRGSSPRVRSRRVSLRERDRATGIISACAEQTSSGPHQTRHQRDHLRVCGADTVNRNMSDTASGSSPRVRSRR